MSVQRVWISDKFQLNLSELSICSVPANLIIPFRMISWERKVFLLIKETLLIEHLQTRLDYNLPPASSYYFLLFSLVLVPPPGVHHTYSPPPLIPVAMPQRLASAATLAAASAAKHSEAHPPTHAGAQAAGPEAGWIPRTSSPEATILIPHPHQLSSAASAMLLFN